MPNWSCLHSLSELDELFDKSHSTPVVLFKHSVTCGVSSRALGEYESYLAGRPEDDAAIYTLVEIQNARPISTAIAERSGVGHESPQVLVVRGGEVAWHASHWQIRAAALASAIDGGGPGPAA